ncbi:MAG: 4-hydroxy-tetrahydrodipicolinate reductase [Bacteroidota bacterium]|nr:4-hydroxy-tetrahydrodipicolinate reductase [Bacteroidota bacterium]MDP3146197.1 4-hydroxy-tetrahydrodipicolinate reductase [Bacteroidota bacterium]MDP3556650.1 4-hydroxy-tetrahydrodipicolinate reductase [Bacteroidota bacterium]
MNIALFGYGKMGKEIEAIALKRNHNIVLKIDKDNIATITDADLKKADVIIEFSTPHSVLENIKKCVNANVPIVVGTTGWYDSFKEIKKLCEEKNGSLFHATNFSLGVNLFFKVNSYLAELMNKYTDYDVSMEEIHHIHKLDKPSGTAITLAEQIIAKIDRKTNWSIESKNSETLFINDIREGEVPGTHIIKYQSEVDDIEIMHKAHNRKGFALGAVIAAEFLNGKKGIYTMNDII